LPFLTPSDMDGGRCVERFERRLSATGATAMRSATVPYGVGVSCIGWQMGKAVYIRSPVLTNQQINTIVFDSSIVDGLFLYYVMSSRREELFRLGSGGSRTPILNKSSFEDLPIDLPPLDYQRAIAGVLGVLDDKIELNWRMHRTLEELAVALFTSWFVEFDPVQAKRDGRHPVGVPEFALSLFPSHFADSELGPIPKGWRIARLGTATNYLNRGFGPSYIDAGGVAVLNQKCVRDHRVDFSKSRRHDPAKRDIRGREIEPWDILVNSTGVGTLGRVAQVISPREVGVVDSHLTIVRANPEHISPVVLGLLILSKEDEIEAMGEGSTGQTELSRTQLTQIPFVLPPRAIQEILDGFCRPIRETQDACDREADILGSLRDTLLPALLSGEVTIAQAENAIGRVA
jgi:type I restriction enzyme S subunit